MANIIVYSAAFLTSVMLLYLLKGQAKRVGLVDYPCDRKRHCGEVPLVGGIAIFLTFAVFGIVFQHNLSGIGALLVGSLIVVLVGAMDDIKALKSRPKFIAQITAATLMCLWGGVVLRDLGTLSFDGSLFTLGSLAVVFTIFATVGVINSINMSDGLDGLSGSLTLVALMGLAIVTFVAGAHTEFSTIMILLSAVGAFLLFNIRFPGRERALVFLGDAGSLFIGFALSWFVISLSQGENRIMAPVTALWFLAIPLFDTVGIMLRRILKGHSPFRADREHFHHAFQLAGFSVLQTQLAITVAAVICMLIGLAGQFARVPEIAMFYLFLGVFGLYFWGMMRAWKVMRFLRRSMHHEAHVATATVNDEVSVIEPQISNATNPVAQNLQSNSVEAKTLAENKKVPLKLVVNSKYKKESNSSSQSIK